MKFALMQLPSHIWWMFKSPLHSLLSTEHPTLHHKQIKVSEITRPSPDPHQSGQTGAKCKYQRTGTIPTMSIGTAIAEKQFIHT